MSVTIPEADRERPPEARTAPGSPHRLAPLTGVAATLLVVAGIVVIEGAWLTWLSLPVALWLLVPPFGSPAGTDWAPPAWSGLAALGALPLWTIATAIALTIRSPGQRGGTAGEPAGTDVGRAAGYGHE